MPSNPDHELMSEIDSLDKIRKHPGMYFGQLGAFAIEHMISELVSNSIDQFLAGHVSEICVELFDDRIEVRDDGLGLPFDKNLSEDKESIATGYFTYMHESRIVDSHAPHVHIHGPCGLGLAPLNAVSISLRCQSWRNGNLWEQRFHHGRADGSPKIIKQGTGRGTIISFVPNAEILKADKPRWGGITSSVI